MAWYPHAQRYTDIAGAGGGSFVRAPRKIVWHKTQGSSSAGAFGVYRSSYTAPHFTVDNLTVYQHIDTNRSGYALVNAGGGVETNRDGVIQIEVVGFSGQDNLPAVHRAATLAEWIMGVHGIPNTWPGGRPPREYVSHSGFRSVSTWQNEKGHFGHSQVPENHHWDPAWTDTEWQIVRGLSPNGQPESDSFDGLNIGGLKVAKLSKAELARWHKDDRKVILSGVAKLIREQDDRWRMGVAKVKQDLLEELGK